MRSRSRDEYADVGAMFDVLAELPPESYGYQRQRDAIVERCLPLADNIARRFKNRGEPNEDLVQVARVGLVNAVKRYDPSIGVDFLAFAVPTMVGEVRRHFRDHGWSVKVPRRLKDLSLQLRRSREELSGTLGRAPTATEIAAHMGVDRDEVVQAQIASSAYSTLSSDVPLSSSPDDSRSMSDGFGELDANLDRVLDVEILRPLLARLPEREQTVLRLRFFGNMTQTQIAARVGISQMHVSRLLSQSLATMRRQVRVPEPV
jgi:RNA polymerase sigma-B factor